MCFNIFQVQKALCCKYSVVSLYRMTFAEYETVAIRVIHVFRRNVHLAEIQAHQSIDHTHVAADMSALSGNDNIYSIFSQVKRFCL